MTQPDPLHRRPDAAERASWVPAQPTYGTGAHPPGTPPGPSSEVPTAPGEPDDRSASRAERDRLRRNAEANEALVMGAIALLPVMARVNSLNDVVATEAVDVSRDERWAKVVTGLVVWKQDRGPNRRVLPGGHPRWVIGEWMKPGSRTKDLLLANADPDPDAGADPKVFAVRVAAAAYARTRRWSEQQLAHDYTAAQDREVYVPAQRLVQATNRLPGAVWIRLWNGHWLRPSIRDRWAHRLPVEKIGDVALFSDQLMGTFRVIRRLRIIMIALGLRDEYDKLEAVHKNAWRPSPGSPGV